MTAKQTWTKKGFPVTLTSFATSSEYFKNAGIILNPLDSSEIGTIPKTAIVAAPALL